MRITRGHPGPRLTLEDQFGQIVHPLRIKNAVQVIAFMLHNAGVEATRHALQPLALGRPATIAQRRIAWHGASQAGHGKTPLPPLLDIGRQYLDFRIDEDGQRCRVVKGLLFAGPFRRPGVRRLKDDDPPGLIDLWCCETGAIGIDHGLDHVAHKRRHLRRGGVWDGLCHPAENRVAHAGNLAYGHKGNMRRRAGYGNRAVGGNRQGAGGQKAVSGRIPGLFGASQWTSPQSFARQAPRSRGPEPVSATNILKLKQEYLVQVLVRDNNVDQAMKALKKKLQREGVFREMKLRNFYEKPSEKRAREKAEAIRRARKLARKRAQREAGIVTAKK